jgi:predicted nucleotidyltransferase
MAQTLPENPTRQVEAVMISHSRLRSLVADPIGPAEGTITLTDTLAAETSIWARNLDALRVAMLQRMCFTLRSDGRARDDQQGVSDDRGIPMTGQPLPHLAPNEQAALTRYVAGIRQRFPEDVLSVTLFGSKARGDASVESDIDLLLLVDEESREIRSELWRIASDVSLEHNVVLSVRVFARSPWAETRRIRLPPYRAIVADGVPLTPESIPAGLPGFLDDSAFALKHRLVFQDALW